MISELPLVTHKPLAATETVYFVGKTKCEGKRECEICKQKRGKGWERD